MNLQLIGTLKCKETKKMERFLKERKIPFHFVNLNERPLSPGELGKIAQAAGKDNLVDENSDLYKKKGMSYMEFDPIEEILEHPLLIKTPILRDGNRVLIGFETAKLKDWLL